MQKHQTTMCSLRIAVAHLGEKPLAGWWETAFLDAVGFRYLELVYPKTAASASVVSSAEAACRAHDERIGKGRVGHLFRLPPDGEAKLRGELSRLEIPDLKKICTKDAALQLLDTAAAGAKLVAGTGPIQIGALKEMNTPAGIARMAATYAAGFRSNTRVFPYFA